MPSIKNITIEQQLAEIGVRKTPAQIHIEQQQMEMKIKTESPKMDIERKNPSFKVVRKKPYSGSSGMKSSQDISKDYRDKGKVDLSRNAKGAAGGSNSVGDVKKPGRKPGRLARSLAKSNTIKKKDSGGLSSKGSPEVEWDKGYMRINWSKHSILIDWDGEYMPRVRIDPKHSIEIYLRTEPYFRIKVNDGKDLNLPGAVVDKAI